jgi:hypothetical protein
MSIISNACNAARNSREVIRLHLRRFSIKASACDIRCTSRAVCPLRRHRTAMAAEMTD